MWLTQVLALVLALFLTAEASTTVLPRPPNYMHLPINFEETTPSYVIGVPVNGLELTAATPSHQPRQIPPPPAPRHTRMTTPGYQVAPPHFRLLWAELDDNIPQHTPQPFLQPTQPFRRFHV
ncbi:uncharacterized protein LOC132203647 [Neocloeon triangulifer]|uniref:uncharacterized protein LOC132203647 n=1 Tax=Neocloeon triangulifer TaxID=2078957 RepID=UPI00286F81F1|nr:uncharacterized protein LOC132203647 [Neocloeon triangulifer]